MIEMTVPEFLVVVDVLADRITEIDYTTGFHHVDDQYSVGWYITRHDTGDWTNHPNYSGVNRFERPEHVSVAEWFRSQLPDDGILRVYVEPIDK